MKRAIGATVAVAIVACGCHTEPFPMPFPYGPAFYGATGPLVAGPEERLTFADTNEDGVLFHAYSPTWASDGSGIIYSFSPRAYLPGEQKTGTRCILNHPCHPVAADPLDQCLAKLPPTGGSAYWNVCETRVGGGATTDILATGNVNHAGQLLFTEISGANFQPVPAGFAGNLWLATPANSAVRQRLCVLFNNSGSGPTGPACGPMTLDDIQWSSANTFTAIGNGAGLYYAAIGRDSTKLKVVPGGEGAPRYALVAGGTAAIILGSDFTLQRLPLPGGGPSVVATLPLTRAGQLLDVGCHPTVCVVLTSDGTPTHWDLWSVDLATGHATVVRTFMHALATAKLSPVSGDVVALEGVNVYLITGVVP